MFATYPRVINYDSAADTMLVLLQKALSTRSQADYPITWNDVEPLMKQIKLDWKEKMIVFLEVKGISQDSFAQSTDTTIHAGRGAFPSK